MIVLAIATVMTTPVVFGGDVTFLCSYDLIMAMSSTSISWLKGQGKETIIYGKNSTKIEKYTSTIHHVADKFQYLLTIHNVSEEDLDIYSCDFDFQYDLITFTLDGNVSFICKYYTFLLSLCIFYIGCYWWCFASYVIAALTSDALLRTTILIT